jgi:hypothetical protein
MIRVRQQQQDKTPQCPSCASQKGLKHDKRSMLRKNRNSMSAEGTSQDVRRLRPLQLSKATTMAVSFPRGAFGRIQVHLPGEERRGKEQKAKE